MSVRSTSSAGIGPPSVRRHPGSREDDFEARPDEGRAEKAVDLCRVMCPPEAAELHHAPASTAALGLAVAVLSGRHPGQDHFAGLNSEPLAGEILPVKNPDAIRLRSSLHNHGCCRRRSRGFRRRSLQRDTGARTLGRLLAL
jgi:hypothetical protein